MRILRYPPAQEWPELLKRPVQDFSQLEDKVDTILQTIKKEGDAAVLRYTEQFDQVKLSALAVTADEIQAAIQEIPDSLKTAIQTAYQNIKTFHSHQFPDAQVIDTMPGVSCWRKAVPIQKVGLYIPGGTAPLFSTVLMLGIPAQLAGCSEIVLCSPPNREGLLHPAILYTAHLIGITKIYKVGGVQAVGAMAYGTASIPQVYKIFGPGNQYVTMAKQLVNKEGIAIDMPAGPSEVLVYADASAKPAFVAADLLSQAEHGIDSQVVLVTTAEEIIEPIQAEVSRQLTTLPRKEIAKQALENSLSIVLKTEATALDLINEYAPEHLILAMEQPMDFAAGIVNAGSVFLGHFTPESVGDYASGTNHTLPTNGFAKAYSGVSLDSFLKKITFQQLTPAGLAQLGPAVEQMAAAEELMAHKRAVSIRLNQ